MSHRSACFHGCRPSAYSGQSPSVSLRPADASLPQAATARRSVSCEQEDGMTATASGALAVELHPHSRPQWVASYYPMVATPAGRWADVTWALHHHRMPTTSVPPERTRWLEVRSPDPDHPCYAGHRAWAARLAAGYAAALAVYDTETTEEPLSALDAQQLQAGTVVGSCRRARAQSFRSAARFSRSGGALRPSAPARSGRCCPTGRGTRSRAGPRAGRWAPGGPRHRRRARSRRSCRRRRSGTRASAARPW